MALGKLLKKTCQINLGLKLKFYKYSYLQILTSVEMNVTFFLFNSSGEEEQYFQLEDLEIFFSALQFQCSTRDGV